MSNNQLLSDYVYLAEASYANFSGISYKDNATVIGCALRTFLMFKLSQSINHSKIIEYVALLKAVTFF